MDTQILQEAPTQPLNGIAGSEADLGAGDELGLYREMTPAIPARFGLNRLGSYESGLAQPQYDQVAQTLAVRRQVLDLEFNIRRNRAKVLIWESLAEEKLHRLTSGEELKPYHRKRIEGELAEAKVMVEYCHEKIEHWHLQIRALRATGREE